MTESSSCVSLLFFHTFEHLYSSLLTVVCLIVVVLMVQYLFVEQGSWTISPAQKVEKILHPTRQARQQDCCQDRRASLLKPSLPTNPRLFPPRSSSKSHLLSQAHTRNQTRGLGFPYAREEDRPPLKKVVGNCKTTPCTNSRSQQCEKQRRDDGEMLTFDFVHDSLCT